MYNDDDKFIVFFTISCIKNYFFKVSGYYYYQLLFEHFGRCFRVVSFPAINGALNIRIGEGVYVGDKSWLAALPLTGEKECLLKLHEGVSIECFNHIYAIKSIVIEKNMLTRCIYFR